MTAKKIEIKIQDIVESMKEVAKVLHDLEAGKKVKPQQVVAFESLEGMRKVLTPQRVLLLRVVRRKKPASVYELAKILGRDRKAVAEDLKVLEEEGLVSFKSHVHGGRARSQPVTVYDGITIDLDW